MDEMTISEEDRRQLGLWAADCAERALPLFVAKAPADARPREAIEGIRAFVREGGRRTAKLRSLAWAAHAAAREVDDAAATAAARAACHAAATPYIHPLATPHQSKHVLGPAVYEALARELAAGDAAGADEEIRWAIEHAPTEVRALLRRMPARSPGRSRLDTLYYELDAALRR
ncbi:putative immunity protein [Streptomyces nojiriensis]|uniref:putative immunity protein n=1 Tax=Streptomyces nojiriensis TaxID=66374 RepID=UPI0036613C66